MKILTKRKTERNVFCADGRVPALFLIACVFLIFPAEYSASSENFARARTSEKIKYADREYFNYSLMLSRARTPSSALIEVKDILMRPAEAEGFALHPDLLERMYSENMRTVFFIVELPPYYPADRYDRLPWGGNKNYFFFGNSFWRDDGRISSVYRRVYSTAGEDFNSQMRRVQNRAGMQSPPEVMVLSRLERTGANSQWRNAWGWSHYFYFEGEDIILP